MDVTQHYTWSGILRDKTMTYLYLDELSWHKCFKFRVKNILFCSWSWAKGNVATSVSTRGTTFAWITFQDTLPFSNSGDFDLYEIITRAYDLQNLESHQTRQYSEEGKAEVTLSLDSTYHGSKKNGARQLGFYCKLARDFHYCNFHWYRMIFEFFSHHS